LVEEMMPPSISRDRIAAPRANGSPCKVSGKTQSGEKQHTVSQSCRGRTPPNGPYGPAGSTGRITTAAGTLAGGMAQITIPRASVRVSDIEQVTAGA
jgi:hypothetical protein